MLVTGRRWIFGLGAVLALNGSLWIAQTGLALPRSLASYFLGPKMVRAEVILKDGGVVHDFRFDQGRIRAVSGSSLTLLERDGTVVTVAVAPGAQVTVGGAPTPLTSLRRGMQAATIREGSGAAQRVIATRR